MSRRIILLFLCMHLYSMHLAAQKIAVTNSTSGFQCGVAVKASLELAGKGKVAVRLGVSGGIGAFVAGDAIYPSLHADCMFYNNGFGSAKNGDTKPAITTDFSLAGTITAGWNNRLKTTSPIKPGIRNYPLYYFSNFNRQPLQNPFNYSLSLGSVLVINPGHTHIVQQVGFINLHVAQFQACYFNDGTPLERIALGDGRDRYYTGGGILSYTLSAKYDFDVFEFGYFKYTGFMHNTFELVNKLDLAFVNYADKRENYYNKSMWTLSAGSTTHRVQASVKLFNVTTIDAQHIIHRYIFNGYHRVPYDKYFTPTISSYYSTTKIGLQ